MKPFCKNILKEESYAQYYDENFVQFVQQGGQGAVGAHLLDDGVHTPLVLPVGVRAAL